MFVSLYDVKSKSLMEGGNAINCKSVPRESHFQISYKTDALYVSVSSCDLGNYSLINVKSYLCVLLY